MITVLQWRTSLLGGEAANLAVVRMPCGETARLQFYLNEREVEVEGCGSPCTVQQFVQFYRQFALADIDTVCKIRNSESSQKNENTKPTPIAQSSLNRSLDGPY